MDPLTLRQAGSFEAELLRAKHQWLPHTSEDQMCVQALPLSHSDGNNTVKCKSEAPSPFFLSVLITTCLEPALLRPHYKNSVFRKISWPQKLLLGSGQENPRRSDDQRKFSKGKCILLTTPITLHKEGCVQKKNSESCQGYKC